jgi:hypothetical protein
VTVFSDAPPQRIARILALEAVKLAPPNPSIVDMLLLARARVLIATGSSTFSGWATLLGAMPTLYYPGVLERLKADYTRGLDTDLDGRIAPVGLPLVREALRPR